MSEFRFAEPQWAHALWGVLALVVALFWLERRGAGALDELLGPSLRDRLVARPSAGRRRLRVVLIGLSLASLVLALMRPQLGVRHVAAPRVGAEIMIALDVSKSMLAEDVAPSRLERAKAEVVDLLGYLEGDQVGLIAFAGRATVLAPMTPDFSFLRLVLEGVGPNSVSRGGTRLEEPIRKAIAGMGEAGEAQRAILLITDGEDHDSFPLDAADAAADAGIVIVAIGFGDERGSEIFVTDPRTGSRELLRDGEGRPVRSRLDGDTLREIALRTGGAYVPAGTGVLDLESIYRQHIERLMVGQLDPHGRTVRDEAYQWAVLLALVLLVCAVGVSGGGSRVRAAAMVMALIAVGAVGVAGAPAPASAQEPEAKTAGSEAAEPEAAESRAAEAAGAEEAEAEDPREIYNRGVAALDAGDPDEAIRLFERARREAAGDGELRFAAAYDLGVAHSRRAEGLRESSPDEALRALYTAADWFRDAIAHRTDHEDSRVNLDVTLRRALLLADQIAQAGDQSIDEQLEQLAQSQRALIGELAALVTTEAAEAASPDDPAAAVDPERLRREFRGRATAQRTVLSDADELARRIDVEKRALEDTPEGERPPEDQMRAVQLEGVLHYLHRAREKMGQSRRQLRQRQGERAFRRGSAALAELKRALDQLRDPVALLDALAREATTVATHTALLSAARRELGGGGAIPPWLSEAGLRDDQQSVAERTDELDRRLLAGESQSSQGSQGSQGSQDAQEAGEDAQQQAMLDAVREAEPFVAEASSQFGAASRSLEAAELDLAIAGQRAGIVALTDARERFLDLRGLIEATYADERRIQGVLGAEGEAAAARDEYLPALRELQARNLARGERLAGQIASAAQAPPQPGPDGAPPDEETVAIEQQRYDLAGQLLTVALGRMDEVKGALEGKARWSVAERASTDSVAQLEALRRLFFSIVEQLRETAEEQVDVADQTQAAAALLADSTADAMARIGPLAPRQDQLGARAGEIASALEDQSNREGGVLDEESDAFETSRRLREAAEHVLLAQTEMEGAEGDLTAEPPALDDTHTKQVAAVAQLEQALELLVPPEQRQQQGDQQQQQQQRPEPGDQQQEQGGEDEGQEPSAEPSADPAQLLQAVRDREAQRRREQAERGRAGYETVEKDW